MSKHTPGPWTLVASRKGWQLPYQIEDSDGLCIVALEHHPVRNNKANASLIAAAPCLLAAAELALANLMRNLASEEATGRPFMGDDEHESISVLRTAIAKARGDA